MQGGERAMPHVAGIQTGEGAYWNRGRSSLGDYPPTLTQKKFLY